MARSWGLKPTAEPQMLFPNLISTSMGEYNGTFSGDGKIFYYTASLPGYDAIVGMHMRPDGTWSGPGIAPFSGKYPDFDPLFAPDGKLYISSRRPLSDRLQGGKSAIWVLNRKGKNWGDPVHLALAQNNAYYSSVTRDGKIYFNTRSEETGSQDIFCASPEPNGYVIKRLGEGVNSGALDLDPFVSPDDKFLIFRSFRGGGLGGADLYISFNVEGRWERARNLGAPVNSPRNESCPWVSADKKIFIFASSRFGNSYYGAGVKTLRDVRQKSATPDNGHLNLYYMDGRFLEK